MSQRFNNYLGLDYNDLADKVMGISQLGKRGWEYYINNMTGSRKEDDKIYRRLAMAKKMDDICSFRGMSGKSMYMETLREQLGIEAVMTSRCNNWPDRDDIGSASWIRKRSNALYCSKGSLVIVKKFDHDADRAAGPRLRTYGDISGQNNSQSGARPKEGYYSSSAVSTVDGVPSYMIFDRVPMESVVLLPGSGFRFEQSRTELRTTKPWLPFVITPREELSKSYMRVLGEAYFRSPKVCILMCWPVASSYGMCLMDDLIPARPRMVNKDYVIPFMSHLIHACRESDNRLEIIFVDPKEADGNISWFRATRIGALKMIEERRASRLRMWAIRQGLGRNRTDGEMEIYRYWNDALSRYTEVSQI